MLALSACSSLPENTSTPSYAFQKPTNTNTANNYIANTIVTANRKSGLADDAVKMILLENGIDAFVARLSLISKAEHSIDLQYYLYQSDLSGRLLTIALWQAAQRGVRIRLLLDDMDMQGKDKKLSALSSHPNVNIRLFNPFIRGKNRTSQFVTQFGSITRRMHNKSLTVDSSITVLGGRNIGDAYFDADQNTAFDDLDIALTGAVVKQVSDSFDDYWNHNLSYPIELLADYQWKNKSAENVDFLFTENQQQKQLYRYLNAIQNNNLVELIESQRVKTYTGKAHVLVDNPDKIISSIDDKSTHLTPQLLPYINATSDELIIVSPYFVPGEEGLDFYAGLIARGVKVKILTNSLSSTDVFVVHAGYAKYRKKLLQMGVKIYEIDSQLLTSDVAYSKLKNKRSLILGKSKASLHAKYFVMDKKTAFIGSLNLDPRSFYENTEIGVIVESPALAKDIVLQFERNINLIAFELSLQDGNIVWTKKVDEKTIRYTHDPYSSWWDRFMARFIGYLPGESQL